MSRDKKIIKLLNLNNKNSIKNYFSISQSQEIKFEKFIEELVAYNKHTNLVGKSTLTDLISRFYDVENGEVKLDGENIKYLKMQKMKQKENISPKKIIYVYNSFKYYKFYNKCLASKLLEIN